ncbi:DUF1353 domain-containing protein [Avibacterium sp. 20-15]|uniref:DUF1353 domain-containing protein n=1 Tax=unclassified Avibacterium TaxID=2685287 RepID=UPI00202736EF|nr:MULTISPECIES: DUF1353 domain-containing protein [unclassified Avibacterium]MCW9733753.1 DUF1353 domain-containing protein [Avibacterium sp. 20-15]URL04078.1 DUF1353 domain-containing protein [Avibacterium sp. 20-132]
MSKKQKHYCTGWKSAPADVNDCCHQHDRDYGINGTVSRKEADERFLQCMLKNKRPILGRILYGSVRMKGIYKRVLFAPIARGSPADHL